jgi:transcription initiation factor TFIID subunit 11
MNFILPTFNEDQLSEVNKDEEENKEEIENKSDKIIEYDNDEKKEDKKKDESDEEINLDNYHDEIEEDIENNISNIEEKKKENSTILLQEDQQDQNIKEENINKNTQKQSKYKLYEEANRERTKKILSSFSKSQEKRFEISRKSVFNKNNMKMVLRNTTGVQINNSILVVVSGISKVYVGELVKKILISL